MLEIMKAKTFNYKKNHILYKEGEHIEGNSIFLIIKGKAEIKYKLKNKKEIKIIIKSGGFIGILENLTNKKYRITDAKFLEESKVCLWEKEDFLTQVSMVSDLGMKSIAFLSALLRTLNHKIQEMG